MVDKHEAVVAAILKEASADRQKKCHVVIMSNGAFGGIYKTLLEQLP
jgi:hypothetical protein